MPNWPAASPSSAPTYQGITGLIGALHVDMEHAGVPTISLRVGVPHYLTHLEHPLAVAALVQHLAHVLGLPLTVDVQQAADRWRAQHDELVADDEQLRAYVRMLEIEYDRRAEAALRRADDIGDQFEAFLREQREERGPDDPRPDDQPATLVPVPSPPVADTSAYQSSMQTMPVIGWPCCACHWWNAAWLSGPNRPSSPELPTSKPSVVSICCSSRTRSPRPRA